MILAKINPKAWRRLKGLLFFAGMCGVLLRFIAYVRPAAPVPADASYDAEERVEFWVKSARCTQASGAFLALCTSQGGLVPIEGVSLADDRGCTLLANVVARFKKTPFTRDDMARIQMFINFLGVITLAGLFWRIGLGWTAILCAGLGPLYAIPGPIPGPDGPSGYIGVACLALAGFLGIWSWRSRELDHRQIVGEGLCYATALGIAILIRGPIGLIGLMLSGISLAILLVGAPHRQARIAYLIVLVALGASYLITPACLALRNAVFHIAPLEHTPVHGISQTLFHGLGTEPNPWGIQWADAYGLEFVHRVDPTIPYLSPAYIQVLRTAYWDILTHHPVEVLTIYWEKFQKSVSLPFRLWGAPLWAIGFPGFCLLLGLLWRSPKAYRRPLEIGGGIVLFTGLFLMQGVLGIPWGNHLYPVKLLAILTLCCFSDFVEQGKSYNFSFKPKDSRTK